LIQDVHVAKFTQKLTNIYVGHVSTEQNIFGHFDSDPTKKYLLYEL